MFIQISDSCPNTKPIPLHSFPKRVNYRCASLSVDRHFQITSYDRHEAAGKCWGRCRQLSVELTTWLGKVICQCHFEVFGRESSRIEEVLNKSLGDIDIIVRIGRDGWIKADQSVKVGRIHLFDNFVVGRNGVPVVQESRASGGFVRRGELKDIVHTDRLALNQTSLFPRHRQSPAGSSMVYGSGSRDLETSNVGSGGLGRAFSVSGIHEIRVV